MKQPVYLSGDLERTWAELAAQGGPEESLKPGLIPTVEETTPRIANLPQHGGGATVRCTEYALAAETVRFAPGTLPNKEESDPRHVRSSQTAPGSLQTKFSQQISDGMVVSLDNYSTQGTALFLRPQTVHSPEELASGTSNPNFIRRERLGKGGMGIVHAAEQASLGRVVAIKQLKKGRSSKPLDQQRFLSEGLVTAALEHPNIVPIHELSCDQDGGFFVAMKRVQGLPWNKSIKDLSLHENIDILLRVADAVGYAHSRGVLHRDLKPANIMVGSFGEVQVMDWGLAVAFVDGAPGERLARNNVVAGTPRYMPPEVASGLLEQVGPASDVYLLGGLLFEILTKRSPHPGSSTSEALFNASRNALHPHPKPEDGDLLDCAIRALAENPGDRPQDVPTFQAMVRAALDHIQSLELSGRAQEDLAQAEKKQNYSLFARASVRVDEALRMWDGNTQAKILGTAIRLGHARCAFDRQDFDFALSLLDMDLLEHAKLGNEIRIKRDNVRRQLTQARRMRHTVYGLIAVVVVGLILGIVWVSMAQRKEAEARSLAERAQKQTEIALDDTKQARLKAEDALKRQEGVSRFLETTLRSADPRRLGRDITVVDAITKAAGDVQKQFPDDPDIQAAIYIALGRTFAGLGRYEDALSRFDAALAIQTKRQGEKHIDVLRIMAERTRLLMTQNRTEEALRILPSIVEDLSQNLGPDHFDVMAVKLYQARAAMELERYEQAAVILRAMTSTLEGMKHPNPRRQNELLLNATCMLGTVASMIGQQVESQKCLKKANDIAESFKGEKQGAEFNQIPVMNLAIIACLKRGKPEDIVKGGEFSRNMLTLSERTNGLDHPTTQDCRLTLAGFLLGTGGAAEAVKLVEECMKYAKDDGGAIDAMRVRAERLRIEAALILREGSQRDRCQKLLDRCKKSLGANSIEAKTIESLLQRCK